MKKIINRFLLLYLAGFAAGIPEELEEKLQSIIAAEIPEEGTG